MMEADAVLDLFRASGALLEGHFRLTSGLHSTGYMQSALVLQHPRHAEALGKTLAAAVGKQDVDVVLSPALGGIVIGHEVARALGARALFAERHEGILTLRRGFTLSSGTRVLVIEDVVTTGGSTRETMKVAQAAGADVIGVGAIIHRGTSVELEVPFRALAEIRFPEYEPAACPLCAQGVPAVKPGSRQA
ncbi:MAG: orotate phosphoribosyltransferase [Vicinamibacteraceae bacterium]